MTDNVSNGKVEDVLSSIKRLVGDEGRNIPDLASTSRARKPGRLVLTESLRINTPPASEAALNAHPAKDAVSVATDRPVKPMFLRAADLVEPGEPESSGATKQETDTKTTQSLSAKIEALEAAIARTEDQWEPDGDSDDDYSGTPNKMLQWHAEDEFIVSVSSDQPIAVQEDTVADAKPSLDEDALRDLIAQVVREELRGVLGQEITRNLRKMIRREIFRALAEQKPD